MLQNIGITHVHARKRINMAPTTRFTDYRSVADSFLTSLGMVNISFILLLSLNFPSLSHIHALSIVLTTFGNMGRLSLGAERCGTADGRHRLEICEMI